MLNMGTKSCVERHIATNDLPIFEKVASEILFVLGVKCQEIQLF